MSMREKMEPVQEQQQDRPELEVQPPQADHPAASRPKAASWKAPAIAGGAAFAVVRLVRIGAAGKLLKLGLKLGRGPAGKMALAVVTRKLAKRKR